jgi:peptidyl-prolyl cis-trans isomerase D
MKNKYEIRGEETAIFLDYKGETLETIIDTEDLEKVKECPNKWCAVYDKNVKDYYATLAADNVSSDSLRDYVKYYLLQVKLQQAYNLAPEKQEEVWARHILVKTEADAAIVINRIKSGEDWTKVAAEVSQDTSTKDLGGDLGWFPRSKMVKPFEDAAFSLKIGEISAPVQTDFGWHVIQVIGYDTLPLSYSDWIASVKLAMKITTGTEWQAIVPNQPTIPTDLKVQ